MTQNPLWPVIDEAVCWPAGPLQSSVQPLWCSMIERTEGSNKISRGKDYELDQTQPGDMTTRWGNDDGAFDADNPASPYAGFINPYRLIRRRAQYPASPNLLTQNQATAGQATIIANAPWLEQPWAVGSTPDANSVYQNVFVPTTIAASASAFTGNQVFASAWPAAGGYGTFVLGMRNWSVAPGVQYAPSVQVRSATPAIAPTVQLQLAWYTAAGSLISVSSGGVTAIAAGSSAAWTAVSVVASAPANAAGALVQLIAVAGPATAWTVHSSGWDVRKGNVAGYGTPGTWYPKFTGYVERWPQSWASGGNYGVVDLTAVDLFANLANQKMLGPFKADLMALNPNFLYALDEASGTNTFADLTNQRGLAAVSRSALGSTIVAGSAVASADNAPPGYDNGSAVTGAFLGAPGPVVQSSVPAGALATYAGGTLQVPASKTGLVGVPQAGGFTRLIAIRVTGAHTYTDSIWGNSDPTASYGLNLTLYGITGTGTAVTWQLGATMVGPGGSSGQQFFNLPISASGTASTTLTVTGLDGDWHLLGVSLSSDGKTMQLWADGNPTPVTFTAAASMRPPAGAASLGYTDTIAALITYTAAGGNFLGNVAFACELPTAMDSATWTKLAQSWRNAWSTTGSITETTDARYQRILTWLLYAGPTRLSSGLCKTVGPATDVAGQFGLQCLQNVVDTEAGQHFIGADGAAVFQSRRDRYNPTPVLTFGENTAAGEIPYLNLATDRDPTRIGNDAQVTSQYGNVLYRTLDAPSRDTYGQITISRTVNSIDPNELTASSQFLVYTNKDPLTRLQAIRIDVGANPGLWPTLLALELGVCVLVKRRPSNAPTISLTCFIEKISWAVDDQNNASCTLQLSNAAKRTFGKYDTTRYAPDTGSMTLQAAITAGQNTLVIATAGGSPTMTNTAGSYPVDIIVDSEQITLTAAPGGTVSPQTFTVIRGVNGTVAAAHLAGAVITLAAAGKWAY